MRTFLLLLPLALLLQSCGGKATTQQPGRATSAIPVKLLPISSAAVNASIEASGLLATDDEARLSFKISGIIDNIAVNEGQQVRKGQLLATIKPTEIAAQVAQGTLAVEKARRDYERARNLYQDSVATLEQLQNAQTGLSLAQQQLRAVAFNRQYAEIYAPADGFIVSKLGNVGELANAGSTVLVMNAVSAGSRWLLKVGLPDRQWALVKTGNKASIQFDAFPGKVFNAVVVRKALSANPASGAFEVALQADFSGVQPGAGMFGKATIFPTGSQHVCSIPYDALLEANGHEGFVFVSNDRKTVQRVNVRVGAISADSVQVTDGLAGYRYVVTAGSPYLTDNARIIAGNQ